MNPTHDWQIDTHSMELVIRRDEADSVGVSLGHDSIDDAHGTTIITSRLLEMIDTVQPGAVRAYLSEQEPTDAEVPESVANLIRDLTDPDDCWFDHSGGCQAHGYLDLAPEQECPHSEAKRLLAARAARRAEGRTHDHHQH